MKPILLSMGSNSVEESSSELLSLPVVALVGGKVWMSQVRHL